MRPQPLRRLLVDRPRRQAGAAPQSEQTTAADTFPSSTAARTGRGSRSRRSRGYHRRSELSARLLAQGRTPASKGRLHLVRTARHFGAPHRVRSTCERAPDGVKRRFEILPGPMPKARRPARTRLLQARRDGCHASPGGASRWTAGSPRAPDRGRRSSGRGNPSSRIEAAGYTRTAPCREAPHERPVHRRLRLRRHSIRIRIFLMTRACREGRSRAAGVRRTEWLEGFIPSIAGEADREDLRQ